jgi:hypothetical protein
LALTCLFRSLYTWNHHPIGFDLPLSLDLHLAPNHKAQTPEQQGSQAFGSAPMLVQVLAYWSCWPFLVALQLSVAHFTLSAQSAARAGEQHTAQQQGKQSNGMSAAGYTGEDGDPGAALPRALVILAVWLLFWDGSLLFHLVLRPFLGKLTAPAAAVAKQGEHRCFVGSARVQTQQLAQICALTDCCLHTFCTWILTTSVAPWVASPLPGDFQGSAFAFAGQQRWRWQQ